MRAIVIIPTYNERPNLETLLQQIHERAHGLHVLIVDDNSPDGTGEAAEALREKYGAELSVLHRQRKEGLGRAYVDGFRHALAQGYDVILQMDADLSHDPATLPVFLDQIAISDAVIGSRYIRDAGVVNWDFKRLVLSKWATRYIRLITRMPFSDATGGFNCWRSRTLEAIGLDDVFSNGYLFQTELKYKAFRKNFKVTEIPIVFAERNLGKSKLDRHIIWEAIWGVLKLRFKY